MSQILVTGGAGFIGSHLVDALLDKGHYVRVLDSLVTQVHGKDPAWPAWLPREVDKILGDVRDQSVWRKALENIQIVYHLAAEVGVGQSMYEITRYMASNTMGTANLLEILAHHKHSVQKLVVASSMSVYGEGMYHTPDGEVVFPSLRPHENLANRKWDNFRLDSDEVFMPIPTNEDKPLRPTSIYAISKRDQEEMCLTVGQAYGIPTTALRFFNTYGPRQALSNPYTGVGAIFSSRIINRKPPIIFEDGMQSRDFVHVKDIVQALLLSIERSESDYQAINVGTGRRVSILEMAELLIQKLNVSVDPEIVGQYRTGDIRHCYADISKARRLLGYQPKIRLEDGIDDLIAWVSRQTAEDKVDEAIVELAAHGLTS